MKDDIIQSIKKAYSLNDNYIQLGVVKEGDAVFSELPVRIPLSTLNRHGLIAGATGTGKTKTLQKLTEQLSLNGVPVMLMDIKGDLSGLAMPGEEKDWVVEKAKTTGIPFLPQSFPLEFLSISSEDGVRVRSTIIELGPVLLSRLMGLNETQSSIIAVLFKYADDNALPLLDLKDLRSLVQYLASEGKELIEKDYGSISPASYTVILRKIMELEQQGAEMFFSEPSFDVNDLLLQKEGKGVVSVLRLMDIQDKPKLFTTCVLSLLAEIYQSFPELGDVKKPKLVVFIDEAHLFFDEAGEVLLKQMETMVRLIRSKGVGIIFCTQQPGDLPEVILSQLGLKIQHALRAFTAKDRKEIKSAALNFPESNWLNTEELLTSLGIGEALVTSLNEKGIPSPLISVLIDTPASRMDVLSESELKSFYTSSALAAKYRESLDRESAFELLTEKIELKRSENLGEEKTAQRNPKGEESSFEKVLKSPVAKQIGRTLVRELTRGLLGVLGLGSNRRRK